MLQRDRQLLGQRVAGVPRAPRVERMHAEPEPATALPWVLGSGPDLPLERRTGGVLEVDAEAGAPSLGVGVGRRSRPLMGLLSGCVNAERQGNEGK